MTSSQEGTDSTKVLIHTVFSSKFGESKLIFFLSPPVLQSSGHEISLIIPQKNSTSFIFHILEGFHDQSILPKDKGGKTIYTNRESPCRTPTPLQREHCSQKPLGPNDFMTVTLMNL